MPATRQVSSRGPAIVSWLGDWKCSCGSTNKLWDICACGETSPCREYVRGNCLLPKCKFPHPPFRIPEHLPKPADPIANPLIAAAKEKAAAQATAAAYAAEQAGLEGEMCIVTWLGHWHCHCGKVHKLWDSCKCGQVPPCREWVRGQCDLTKCRFPHPPFAIPASIPKPDDSIANPTPEQLALTPKNIAAALASASNGASNGSAHAIMPPPPPSVASPAPAAAGPKANGTAASAIHSSSNGSAATYSNGHGVAAAPTAPETPAVASAAAFGADIAPAQPVFSFRAALLKSQGGASAVAAANGNEDGGGSTGSVSPPAQPPPPPPPPRTAAVAAVPAAAPAETSNHHHQQQQQKEFEATAAPQPPSPPAAPVAEIHHSSIASNGLLSPADPVALPPPGTRHAVSEKIGWNPLGDSSSSMAANGFGGVGMGNIEHNNNSTSTYSSLSPQASQRQQPQQQELEQQPSLFSTSSLASQTQPNGQQLPRQHQHSRQPYSATMHLSNGGGGVSSNGGASMMGVVGNFGGGDGGGSLNASLGGGGGSGVGGVNGNSSNGSNAEHIRLQHALQHLALQQQQQQQQQQQHQRPYGASLASISAPQIPLRLQQQQQQYGSAGSGGPSPSAASAALHQHQHHQHSSPVRVVASALMEAGLLDPAFYHGLCAVDFIPDGHYRQDTVTLEDGVRRQDMFNTAVDAYLTSGIDRRSPQEVAIASKIGADGGPLVLRCGSCAAPLHTERTRPTWCPGCRAAPFCGEGCARMGYAQHRAVCGPALAKPLLPSQVVLRIGLEGYMVHGVAGVQLAQAVVGQLGAVQRSWQAARTAAAAAAGIIDE